MVDALLTFVSHGANVGSVVLLYFIWRSIDRHDKAIDTLTKDVAFIKGKLS